MTGISSKLCQNLLLHFEAVTSFQLLLAIGYCRNNQHCPLSAVQRKSLRRNQQGAEKKTKRKVGRDLKEKKVTRNDQPAPTSCFTPTNDPSKSLHNCPSSLMKSTIPAPNTSNIAVPFLGQWYSFTFLTLVLSQWILLHLFHRKDVRRKAMPDLIRPFLLVK